MSNTSFTAKDMLLNNLSEHRVIRIDGSDRWMDQLIDEIIVQSPDSLLFEADLQPVDIEAKLAHFLGVENYHAQIRQALENKSLLNKRLVIILSSASVNADSLSYLMELTEIGEFHRNAVTLVLRTSHGLVELLTTTPALAARLDGYYEEEKNAVKVSGSNIFNPMLVGTVAAVVLLAGAAGYYFLSGSDTAQPEPAVAAEPAKTAEPNRNAVANVAPELAEKPVTAPVDVNSRPEKVTESLARPVQPEQNESVVEKNEQVTTDKMVAELAQVLDKSTPEAKKTAAPEAQADAPADVQPVAVTEPVKPVAQVAIPESKQVTPEVSLSENTPAIADPVAVSAETAAGSVAHLNNAAAVKTLISEWQDAWGKQDWPRYINAYIQELPHGVKMSLEEWREFRKERLLSPPWVKLEFGEVRLTRLNSHWFRAEFYQRFEKPNYADETTKRLELRLTTDGWKIASENPIGTVVLKRSAN